MYLSAARFLRGLAAESGLQSFARISAGSFPDISPLSGVPLSVLLNSSVESYLVSTVGGSPFSGLLGSVMGLTPFSKVRLPVSGFAVLSLPALPCKCAVFNEFAGALAKF